MVFNSFEFAVFLPLVFILYWTVLRKRQNLLLLVGSYIFYGWWDWRFLSLIVVSTFTDFYVAQALAKRTEARQRRSFMLISILVNLGILGFFKYFNFFIDSTASALDSVGLEPNLPTLTILLPVGISFYTFQTLGYTIDVYRGKMEPTTNWLSFAVYVAYFPQLVAGPIERARRLLPQIERVRTRLTDPELWSGIYLILLGLFRKVVIADGLAPIVGEAFGRSESGGWLRLLLGIYAFSLQIYGDFAGYSAIARGTSRLLGIELMENFRQPYLSRNITHFWRTWHISLSTWLRDYLYITIGGNRRGNLFTYRNLMLTMLLGGLWHGAAWTFVVWGGLHGVYLAAHRSLRHKSPKAADDPFTLSDLVPTIVTFHLVTLSWIFFRADSFSQAWDYLTGIVTLRGGVPDLVAAGEIMALLVPLGLLSFVIDFAQRQARSQTAQLQWPVVSRGLAYGVMVVGLIVFTGGGTTPFIYFQF
ncbi:MAG: MBOAT family protein [Acidimicrobiia bacterium]|nr:MBOAT family protein [Acidimicrobiia bacterium]